ncbi:Ger(x)C family spore germination protein [Paenibacillus mendelii]|uniref:Ger(X)C family spore germination protein n=1 Tax=Paenibacillus mendelii TaxID=206163 RepID=A0ABV6JFL6_9BACL|nr:Ger(x)C family spore germination protein [Paenibacillus mendelii]MCQ6562628.1 Ger(x)C family spore germination protein [Paenibacillus mendelii]
MRKGISLLIAIVLLTGCRDEKVIDRLGFISTIAYDLAGSEQGNNMLHISISIPKAQPFNERVLLSTYAKTSKEARFTFSRQNNRQIVNGQLRSVLFGKTLAEQGLWSRIDTLVRDPGIDSEVSVVVVSGDANALLKSKYPQYSESRYIDELIQTETKSRDIPNTNLHSFTRDYFDDGIDPTAPLLKKGDMGLEIDGIALFHEDRYVARIAPEDALLFSFLTGNFHTGDITVSSSGGDGIDTGDIMMGSLSSKRSITIRHLDALRDGNHLDVTIKLKIRGSLMEYIGPLKLQQSADQIKLESDLNKYVEKKTEAFIRRMQAVKADPIGIGLYARSSMRYKQWKAADWHDRFPHVKVHVKADVKIKDIGKLQQS